MGWLGEELAEHQQAGATPFAPRCLKDVMEEELFARRHGLFSTIDLVFMDTTSLYFEARAGRRSGSRASPRTTGRTSANDPGGAARRRRPAGMRGWPGNTADVGSLIPAVDRRRVAQALFDQAGSARRRRSRHDQRGDDRGVGGPQAALHSGSAQAQRRLVRELVLDDPAPFVPSSF